MLQGYDDIVRAELIPFQVRNDGDHLWVQY
jgi:hypothetical protein